ncbi:HNH endonuclease [Methylobacterium trifolii]|uniref:HNH nuclease domain-containing protein n=1 Tax=Methylobacterium trifolii TaxID=1003092 RepID=A0ABQ4U3S7_9HYPH|nr:HNH endonuclease signature motif containing protein [Methylobacterium trifolii]GJE62065.1 hypothetical protein MPOCJGCO_4194 [Methylobacterium trifolii]
MSSYWLTFKPLGPGAPRGWPIEHLRDLIRRVDADPDSTTEWWRIAAHGSASAGERVYIFQQGTNPRGIFGVGRIVGSPKKMRTSTDPDVRPRAQIRFERLVDPTTGFLLPLEAIDDVVPATLVNAFASGWKVADEVADELEKRLAPLLAPVAPTDSSAFDPSSSTDEREKLLRQIHARRGQPEFRAKLLKAYGGCCAMTGCTVEAALEAAHLSPYQGPQTNHVTNGILLRADIHTLYDCGLISINPETREVVVSSTLAGSEYATIAGRPVKNPASPADKPSTENLRACFKRFETCPPF